MIILIQSIKSLVELTKSNKKELSDFSWVSVRLFLQERPVGMETQSNFLKKEFRRINGFCEVLFA